MSNSKWSERKVGEIATFTYGYTAAAKDSGDVRFLRITDIDNSGFLKESNDKYINLTTESERYLLKNEDIVVARTGATYGKTLLFRSEYPTVFASFLIRINLDKDKIIPQYYFHFSRSDWYWFQARNLVTGGGQPQFNANILKEIKITFPSIRKQKAIADVLPTWDEAIEKTERLITTKEKGFRQIAKWLLLGRKRINPALKCKLVDGHFFKYPRNWDYLQIKDVSQALSIRNINTEKNPTVLSCSKYKGFVNSLDYFGKKIFSDDTSNYKVIKKGQFGYPANHIEEGFIGLLSHCEIGVVSPIYVVFSTSPKKVYAPFLYMVFKTDVYQHIFQISTSSSVDRRGSLRWSEFSRIRVPLPSVDEQKQIAETLNNAQSEINLLKKIAEQYKDQKRGLMQKLLTGEWRVKLNGEVKSV